MTVPEFPYVIYYFGWVLFIYVGGCMSQADPDLELSYYQQNHHHKSFSILTAIEEKSKLWRATIDQILQPAISLRSTLWSGANPIN